MPILVKDYTWTQSSTDLHIRIPLRSVYREKIDFFTSDRYLKAHFSPFLFELFLMHDVDIEKSRCVIKDDVIIIDLVKKEEHIWTELEKKLSKDDKMNLRKAIIEEYQERAKKAAEDKKLQKNQLDRFTVQQAMDIDNKQHTIMDSRRDEERNKFMNDLEIWKERVTDNKSSIPMLKQADNSTPKIIELSPSDDEDDSQKNTLIPESGREIAKKKVKSEYVDKIRAEAGKRVLPKLREVKELKITHTPRSFPTPCRESTAVEEEIWLRNITLARRATGFVSEDLRPEEQDPQWCKEKGDEFFRNGNFLGAISAYTHGITLSAKLPSLYANRAAAHFALGNFNKCANDCSTALELMVPACEGNRRSRGKCIVRRAASLARLGYLNKAIDEMKAASKLLPDDENIKRDIYDMERAWEQNPDSD